MPGGTGLPYHPLWEPAVAPEKTQEEKVKKKVKTLTREQKFDRFFGTAFALWFILTVGSVGSVIASETWGIVNGSTDSKRVKPKEDVELDEKIDKYLDGEVSFRSIADEFPSLDRRMHPLLYSRAVFVCDHSASRTDDPSKVQEYKDQVTNAWIAHYSSGVAQFRVIARSWVVLFVIFMVLVIAAMITATTILEPS
ncbi:MAG: hypothetical protein E6R03_10135 [Hyphomicrobiaceae bacterium]|nr:MAG: hypothetical protein E6R03_10135 [Hyphomicrobiaceae bacterium]